MDVNIMTDNGHMWVKLDAYLPASAAKVRKLFRLMKTGLPRQEKLAVREYLQDRIKRAGASRDSLEKQQEELEAELTKQDLAYADLIRRRKDTRQQLTSAKKQMREIGKITASGASWLRMFDEICMGADQYVKDLTGGETNGGRE